MKEIEKTRKKESRTTVEQTNLFAAIAATILNATSKNPVNVRAIAKAHNLPESTQSERNRIYYIVTKKVLTNLDISDLQKVGNLGRGWFLPRTAYEFWQIRERFMRRAQGNMERAAKYEKLARSTALTTGEELQMSLDLGV